MFRSYLQHWYLHISFDYERAPTDPESVESMIEKLSPRGITNPLPTDPESVESMIEKLSPRGITNPLPTDPESVEAA